MRKLKPKNDLLYIYYFLIIIHFLRIRKLFTKTSYVSVYINSYIYGDIEKGLKSFEKVYEKSSGQSFYELFFFSQNFIYVL